MVLLDLSIQTLLLPKAEECIIWCILIFSHNSTEPGVEKSSVHFGECISLFSTIAQANRF
jgi:hypothetical protein